MNGLVSIDSILKENNYFKVLGVAETAEEEELRQAFRKLAKVCHPDRYQDNEEKKQAQKAFSLINKAFSTLKNPIERKEYETALKLQQNHGRLSSDQKQEKAEDFFNKGLKLEGLDNLERAIHMYQEAIRLDSRNSRYHSQLGLALQKKGWIGYAQAEFKIALTHDPSNLLALKFYRPTNGSSQKTENSLGSKLRNFFSKQQARLGDILIAEGLLEEPQLRAALKRQKDEKLLLGEILIRMNFLKPEQLAQALIIQSDNIS